MYEVNMKFIDFSKENLNKFDHPLTQFHSQKNFIERNLKCHFIKTFEDEKQKEILYSTYQTPFGASLIAMIDDKICFLAFTEKNNEQKILQELKSKWPRKILREGIARGKSEIEKIFYGKNASEPLNLLLRASDFQNQIWLELLKIPLGETRSYQDIACQIGMPKSVRAAARAISSNRLAYLIPCHRVIAKNGSLSGYEWGIKRKAEMLEMERKWRNNL